MSIQPALTSGQLTDLRSGDYRALQFIALCPNDVLFQFQPSSVPARDVYAEIAYSSGTAISGSQDDVRAGQTVVYSTTSDYVATETYRTYVRKVTSDDALRIGESGQGLTTSTYITVINTYEVWHRPRVVRNGTEYADWDITFRRLLPIENDLPTAVVLTDGTTSYSPTGNPQAIDADATSTFTHAWESSNSNDGVSDDTTDNPSFTLEANSFRWIRYTFTDSNGNSNYRVIGVWTVPTDYSNVNLLTSGGPGGDFADLQYDTELGYIGSVPALSDITDLLPDTFCCVFTEEWINGSKQNIDGNINFVGYLSSQTTRVRGDERYGRISDARLTLEGLGSWMSRTPVSTLDVRRAVIPADWGDIEDTTIDRVVTYIVAEHSTLFNLASVTFPSDVRDFTASDDFFKNAETVLFDSVADLIDTLNAKLQWHPDGRAFVTRRLIHLNNAARDAATTVVDFNSSDFLEFSIERPQKTVNFLEVGGGVFDTSTLSFVPFRALVPPRADIRGTESRQVANQLLETDTTESTARAELGQRAANRYAALNPTYVLRGRLKDEWGFLVPDVGAWVTVDVDASSNPLGLAFDSGDRWQILEVGTIMNNETGTREVDIAMRLETSTTGANIDVAAVTTNPDDDIDYKPAILPPYSGGDEGLTGGDYFDNDDTAPASDPNPPPEGCEASGFRIPNGATGDDTDTVADPGQEVEVTVRGSGRLITGGSLVDSFTVDSTDGSPTAGSLITNPNQVYRVVVNGIITINTSDGRQSDALYIDLDGDGNLTQYIGDDSAFGVKFSQDNFPLDSEYNDSHEYEFIVLGDGNVISAIFEDTKHSDNSGTFSIDVYEVSMYGDAFYIWSEYTDPQAYPSGEGLEIDGSPPGGIPPYNTTNEYVVFHTSAGGIVQYTFDNPFSPSRADNWSLQIISCFL